MKGRKFARRPRLRWKEQEGGLLVAVEYNGMEEVRRAGPDEDFLATEEEEE